ncbi:MAG: hypothetical protein PQJ58_05275 [Spirochaetales bacterium]|nr:hypothetical protein [Spirochaetales bacterium]
MKLSLSDQSFEVSEATLSSSSDLSDYTGTTQGSITEVDSNTLEMEVEAKYYDGSWLNYNDYISALMDFGLSETDATSQADSTYITTTINYQVSEEPASLYIDGINEFSGTYYISEIAAVVNE